MEDDFFALFYSRELNEFVDALMHDDDSNRALTMISNKAVDFDSRYCVDGVDMPVLYIAVVNKKFPVVDELIRLGARFDDYVESCGTKYSLVFYALVTKNYDSMTYFEANKADIQASASDGTDALYWACVNRHLGLVERFVRAGFDTKKYYYGR